jgi:hypothetical protein
MNTGARYEIRIDGILRTCRDRREIALEAAGALKAANPYSKVVIRDGETGETIETAAIIPLSGRPGR